MPKYSASLGFFFTDVPLARRFELARDAGFRAVEFFWPQDLDIDDLARARREAGVDVVLFNMDEGDYANGERGFTGNPARREAWRASLRTALDLAEAVGCPRINALVGNALSPAQRPEQLDCIVENLKWAAPLAAERGVALLLEPLNAATHPTYLCRRTSEALDLMDRIDEPNVALQYDIYQAQRGEGDVVATLRATIDRIAHVQIADSPTRAAPGTGELNFPYILAEIDATGYSGHVGLEYQPAPAPADPFAWLPRADRG
jgi:hydroxypyruvate isomerase